VIGLGGPDSRVPSLGRSCSTGCCAAATCRHGRARGTVVLGSLTV